MDTPIIITCGATLADILRRYPSNPPIFEKLRPHDPRGNYGEYVVWLSEHHAATIVRQYRDLARCA
jgi:hypothetical protein